MSIENQYQYWLSPSGKVYQRLGVGSHITMAFEIIDEIAPGLRKEAVDIDEIEYLENRGYIRYCNWGSIPMWIVGRLNKPNRIQRQKMYELTGYEYEQ